MDKKIIERTAPSIAAVEAEAARIEGMIAAATKRIESPHCDLRTRMHLQVSRAELQAYFAGLVYALGYTSLMDTKHVDGELCLSEVGSFEDSFIGRPVGEDEDVRFIRCYEC